MYNLLNAAFFRLKKNKVFWTIILLTFVIALFFFSNRIKTNAVGATNGIDQLLVDYLNVLGIFISVFSSFFIGSEYLNGTIRTKIIVGKNRMKIYMSNLIICIIVGVIIELLYILLVLVIGVHILGGLQMPLSDLFIILLNIFMIIVTYSCIFNFVALLCTDFTVSTVINICLIFIMIIASNSLSFTANSTEFLENSVINSQNEIETIKEKNPNYPGEEKKKIAQFFLYLMPSGQTIQILGYRDTTNFKSLLLYSFSVSFIISSIGIFYFYKKDIK